MAPMCNAALTVSLVAWDHERKLLENQSSRLESKKHQDLHQRKRGHAHHFNETIEEAFRERRRRKRQMSLVTLEDVSREKRDEEIQEEIRSIIRNVASSFSSSSRVLALEEEQFDCCAESRPL